MTNLYAITFTVGRKSHRWCRFATTEAQAKAEALTAIAEEYTGKKVAVTGIILTSTEAEDAR